MSILETINSSNDVKNLSADELNTLCSEIRDRIVETVSKNGGHLSSNLGAVELTVALHRVYNSSVDRIIFDVGHQCYAHKIITGRNNEFSSLRQYNGISGFPKPYEADDDAFIAGHASTSVSVALGMAKARTLMKSNYDVVAVIGDGALTGGLAYEGLVNIASSKEPVVIVLNDNNMSIGKNVGGTASLLQGMRVKQSYLTFKRLYRKIFGKLPALYKILHKFKDRIKKRFLPNNIFREMGFEYLGPIDGHNISEMENVFRIAKEMACPVIVHVLTVKGKGVSFAENNPELFHGVGPFDSKTGEIFKSGISFSDVFGDFMCGAAENDPSIVAISAAMTYGTGLKEFSKKYKDRYFDVGIAEGHAVTTAAAMAKQGLLPVFAVYSSFLQRGYDMLIHDVALQNLHVVFAVDRSGPVGSDGETHHGIFDVSFLSSVPGITILTPASYEELKDMLYYALYCCKGPVAVRYPRGCQGTYIASSVTGETVVREGTDITIVAYGTEINEIIEASNILADAGISSEVIKLNVLKPNKFPMVMDSLKKTGKLFVAEETCSSGCIGYKILTIASQMSVPIHYFDMANFGEGIVVHGNVSQLRKDYCLDGKSIADRIIKKYE